MKNSYILLFCLVFITSSCGKFLEEYSRDLTYVETAEDLNKLMIGEAFIPSFSLSISNQSTMSTMSGEVGVVIPWLHVMDDDSESFLIGSVDPNESTPQQILAGFHNWAQVPAVNVLNMSWEDNFWRKVYKRIGALNALIFQADNLAQKSPEDVMLKHLRGEAFFLRAYYYFLLQNIYGAPYRRSTASMDEGVPLKVSEKVEDKYFNRDKNDIVYAQIIADLNQAAMLLEGYNPDTKLRVGIAAVRTLQSRVYLFTEQYDKVLEATEGFENMGYSLQDLNQYASGTNFTFRTSSESIFTMGPNTVPAVFLSDSLGRWNGDDNRASSFRVANNLIQTYQADDIRQQAFFRQTPKSRSWLPGKYRTFTTFNDMAQVSCTFSFRYAEVVLNRAEALAMTSADQQAREELQKLRLKRVRNASISQIPSSDQDLIEFVRAERRRELCFEGHRWFDLRRYAVNTQYPLPASFMIKHPTYTYDPQTNTHTPVGNYVLNAIGQDAASWQVPIPNYAIEFNRGSLTNPVRTLRSIQPL